MADNMKEDTGSLSLMNTISLMIGAHIIMMLTDGATLSFGIFLTDFADELNVGLGVIGAASSLLSSILHIFSPLGAYIASKIGYRRTVLIGSLMIAFGFMISSQVSKTWQLFISHSLFTGFGISLVYTNTVTFVGMTCDKHMSIANGVTTAGTAVGWITFPIVINVLRGFYGWRGSLLLLGAIGLHATVLTLLVFNPRMQSRLNLEMSERINECSKDLDGEMSMDTICGDNDVTEIKQIKTRSELLKEYIRIPITYPLFGFLIIVANFISFAFSGTLNHLVSSAIKGGISESKAAILLTVFGIGNIISRTLHGVPIKLKLITINNLFALALVVSGISTAVLPFCKTYKGIASVTLFIGLAFGTCVPIVYLYIRQIVGITHFPKAMGIFMFTTGFTGVIGGFFVGWIYDVSGSYNIAFFIMGSFLVVGCFILIVPSVCLKYRNEGGHRPTQ